MSTLYLFVAPPGIGTGGIGKLLKVKVHYELRNWMPEILAALRDGKVVATFTTPLGLEDEAVVEFLNSLKNQFDVYRFDAQRIHFGHRLWPEVSQ